MAIYAIADLHLSHAEPKGMEIFGAHWENHWDRIAAAWKQCIADEDLVLIPGDISWAMHADGALIDLRFIGELPGSKLILRGNHDYWWSSLNKVRSILPKNMFALQNDSYVYRGHAICGSRGWVVPGTSGFVQEDQKLYLREIGRLKLSLDDAEKKALPVAVVMMHFPPLNEKREENGFTELFKQYGVKRVLYGHLHGKALQYAFEGELDGVRYETVSCDHLGFIPKCILSDHELADR
jgi:uncharacterized protein